MTATPSFRPAFPGIAVLDRYLATQLTMPFLFGVGAFSSIGVSVGTLFDLIRKMTTMNLPLDIAVQVFFLQLPYYISLALPMSTLLATLILYSRLSTDSELIALRSSGISPYRLVLPAVALSFFITGMSFAFSEAIVPAAKYRATVTLEQALNEDNPKFQESNILSPQFEEVKQPDGSKDRILTRLFYASKFNGREMQGLTVLDFSKEGLNQIIAAQSAMWDNKQGTWDFFNGTVYLVAPDGSYRNIVKFQQQQLQLPRTPLDLANRKKDWEEMTVTELREAQDLSAQSGDDKQVRKFDLRIQQKLAIPFICLVFGLVGATLGMRPQRRSGKGASFAISVLIIFGYYILLFLCDAMGNLEILAPVVAAWLPNLIGLSIGGFLLTRTAK
ncbi:LptF/LptG family permease [Alkalinema sp. FACHB-956]|uniref:LptF/LptG family permease n=1 Tax=Alkalinema sp. FACHB-956 TaxID=2692768 RepID=UPI001684C3F3|nr:LptF/LptG family permease [Alkalinema sp. FACHB-956]MBD2327205.1 LptF/LptG family permease [Alkalinema sp. FACHB-956]